MRQRLAALAALVALAVAGVPTSFSSPTPASASTPAPQCYTITSSAAGIPVGTQFSEAPPNVPSRDYVVSKGACAAPQPTGTPCMRYTANTTIGIGAYFASLSALLGLFTLTSCTSPGSGPTPTPSATATPTHTPSPTPTGTPTPTIAPSASARPTSSPTPSPTASATATATPTASPSPTPSATASPTPTPSPSPTASPTSLSSASPSPTASSPVVGLPPAANSGYVTPSPTMLPVGMPTAASMVARFYRELDALPTTPNNPFAPGYAVAASGAGADVHCTGPYLRDDAPATPGTTGAEEVCVNGSQATAEPVTLTPNQATTFVSFETQSSSADGSTGFCYGFTSPSTDNEVSFHNCSIGITVAAGSGLPFGSASAIAPGGVRFISLVNGTAVTASTPTPVPIVTPTPSPTPVPVNFPSDYPSAYVPYVNALIAPIPTTTYYPLATTPVFHLGGSSGFEYFTYTTSAGEVLLMPYFPQPSATPNSFSIYVTSSTPGTGISINATAFLPTPAESPCAYGRGLYLPATPGPTSTGSSQAYGICDPGVIQVDAAPPTPNPNATYSPYPGMLDANCGDSGTYLSRPNGPFPPASKVCMFRKNPMVGFIPVTAQIDSHDSDYMAHSGVANGPYPLQVAMSIAGGAGAGFAPNWVTNGAPSIALNETCSATCGTMSKSPTYVPVGGPQVGGAPDCHSSNVYFSLGYVEDFWQTNKTASPICTGGNYQGATLSVVAATRLSMSGDGMHSLVTASSTSSEIGMIKAESVLDRRVSTFESGIQIATPCTNNFEAGFSYGSDGGIGSACNIGDGVQPPNGSEIMYVWSGAVPGSGTPQQQAQAISDQTVQHIVSCGLDPLSQKWWLTLAIGFGHGAFITDTNGGATTQYYVQTESDRSKTRWGVASGWQAVAVNEPNATYNVQNGTYSFPISYGTNNCISNSDVHFVSPETPNVPSLNPLAP